MKIFKRLLKIMEGVVFIAVIIGVLYFISNRSKTVAPYEFIRRGMAYIDEKKYERGIKYLNRAYLEAPNSDNIIRNVSYGYMKYARVLNNEEKPEQAAKLLEKAYRMDYGNLDIAQNLAYLYCKMGVEESNSQRMYKAVEYFQKAIDLAMKSNTTRANISNALYNMAIEAFNKDQHNTVLLCLKSSYVLWNRFMVLDLLGHLYYKDSNSEKAAFYWAKALELQPNNEKIISKLDRARKDILAKRRMENVETEYFDIQLYKNYNLNLNTLKEGLQRVYNMVGGKLGYYPPSKTKVVFYSEHDFRNIYKMPVLYRGLYDGAIRIPISENVDEKHLITIIIHEYTHVIVSMLTDNKCPVWLNEGIATYMQNEYDKVSILLMRYYLSGGGELSIKLVEKGFKSPEKNFDLALSYQGAYAIVSFITDKWGWGGIRELLKEIKEGEHYSTAIDAEFLVSVDVFNKMADEYARNL